MRIFGRGREFECPYCPRWFRTSGGGSWPHGREYMEHLKEHPRRCRYCGELFQRNPTTWTYSLEFPWPTDEYLSHLSEAHLVRECPYCGYAGRGSDYDRHIAREETEFGAMQSTSKADISPLRESLGKRGPVQTPVKCPKCGADLKLERLLKVPSIGSGEMGVYSRSVLEELR